MFCGFGIRVGCSWVFFSDSWGLGVLCRFLFQPDQKGLLKFREGPAEVSRCSFKESVRVQFKKMKRGVQVSLD